MVSDLGLHCLPMSHTKMTPDIYGLKSYKFADIFFHDRDLLFLMFKILKHILYVYHVFVLVSNVPPTVKVISG